MDLGKAKRGWGLVLLVAALLTLALKFTAYAVSDSVGLFSDAAESLVNLGSALLALLALTYAAKPADRDHPYGHEKIEFFASGLEGAFIVVASVWIVYEAVHRFFHPEALSRVGLSLVMASMAALINGIVAKLLLVEARSRDSIVLEASARHLMADVWTTAGVIVGLALFLITGLAWLDPLLAFLVGLHVIWSGGRLIRRSYQGLMDTGLPESEILKIQEIIRHHLGREGGFHALRTRKSGARRFVDFHLLLRGKFSLRQSHEITLKLERELENAFTEMDVTIHMEPVEDPQSWEESSLSRLVE